jgi:hypothetical protein
MNQSGCETPASRIAAALVLTTLFASCQADRGGVPLPPSPVAPVVPVAPPSPPPAPGIARSFAGTVHEVNGGPLGGVRVSPLARFGGATTVTDGGGRFEFETIADERGLFFEKPGYRWNTLALPSLSNPAELLALSARLQPIIALSADARVDSVITPDDLTYSSELANSFWDSSYYCSPCKEIRVVPTAGGGGTLHLRWTGSTPLDLWGGQYYAGVLATAVGQAGQTELTLKIPNGTQFDTLLVGVGQRGGAAQTLQESVSFQLTIDPAVIANP